jgi:hypothetical protein
VIYLCDSTSFRHPMNLQGVRQYVAALVDTPDHSTECKHPKNTRHIFFVHVHTLRPLVGRPVTSSALDTVLLLPTHLPIAKVVRYFELLPFLGAQNV